MTHRITDEKLAQVAEVYSTSMAASRPPLKAVAGALGIPERTASYWIRKARERGLIGEYDLPNVKVQRVADRLGVSYADLMLALHEEADGDLRVHA